jgi:ribosomal protein L16 Arg81 hydroxylase
LHTPTFGELVGDERVFFDKYFNQQPLLRRKAILGNARDILSAEDLDELLHSESLRMPYVSIPGLESSYRQNRRIHGELVADCVVPERVNEHFRSGSKVDWYSMNHFFPNLRELTSMLGERFASRSEAIAILSPARTKDSVGYHHDSVDLFVIQLEGSKRWQVWATRKEETSGYTPDELGEPLLETDLEPGDVLYMPYYTPHFVSPRNEMSLHLSVAVRPRTWSELLISIVTEITNNDPAFSGFPYLNGAPSSGQAMALKERIRQLAEQMATIDPGERLREFAETGRRLEGVPSSGHLFRDTGAIDRAAEAARFTRGSAEVSFGETSEGKTTVQVARTTQASVNGNIEASTTRVTIKVPQEIAAALQKMGENSTVQAEDLFLGADAGRSLEAAKTLARLDILRLVP